MMKRKLIPLTLFLTALSVSTASMAASQEISKSIYTCNDNQVMEVIYVNTEAGNAYAIISQVNEMIPMRLMKMASGANYEAIDKNYTYKLYTKGKTAELVEGDDKPVLSNCYLAN
ncbi:lysozyme inhibitor [Salmonella enterica subsp. salamae serovar 57:z29:z42]|uniref:c-type lysozyme inhibitor n=1 Tax=Salmonella enterica TaxID=28901 RepID=UPI000B7BB005|nr:c-type lysozyme inhibitor [Salmonella enterica]ASO10838.1 lysozyme inhibitor [Salmonella enterica subsp. salamae serovar 57:z29:z42]